MFPKTQSDWNSPNRVVGQSTKSLLIRLADNTLHGVQKLFAWSGLRADLNNLGSGLETPEGFWKSTVYTSPPCLSQTYILPLLPEVSWTLEGVMGVSHLWLDVQQSLIFSTLTIMSLCSHHWPLPKEVLWLNQTIADAVGRSGCLGGILMGTSCLFSKVTKAASPPGLWPPQSCPF